MIMYFVITYRSLEEMMFHKTKENIKHFIVRIQVMTQVNMLSDLFTKLSMHDK